MEYNSLPNEIIAQICFYLCSHCQNPGVFPNSNTEEARTDKATLARLCRTSKGLCSIAQPVLFHYYASGNLARSVDTEFIGSLNYTWHSNIEYWNLEDDKLVVFVRTLITRPDLAACVESLQLQGSGVQDVCTPELMRVLGDAGTALGFKLPIGWRWGGWSDDWPDDIFDGDDWRNADTSGIINKNRLDFHTWIMVLTIALTPRTETLMYMCQNPDELDLFKDTQTVLPALTTLALRGAEGFDYYLFAISHFLTAIPNLQTLYALDCRGNAIASTILSLLDDEDGDSWTKDLAVGKVQKLVLDELPKAVFESLMERCVELEDLVYYIHYWYDCPDITRAFSRTEKRLKKLCFGQLPQPVLIGYEGLLDDDDDYGNITTVTSLREFTQLEELVIDQALLYGRSDSSTGTERLETLLPPSIQKVNFTYVYKSMYANLMHLASAAPRSFPKLRSVKIGLLSPIPPERAVEIEHMKAVESEFASVGVHISWEENFMGPFLYTAIPGGTPGLMVPCVPSAPLPFPSK
ncbi:hypothetical protein V497_07529 [Pseudogymnoascus sp. VKM F-4516 (FW-969)]|nr:hypothetical protein V497_07529 [Pseudogymnoascus sp. VKM F-4516 (FW-969)]